MTKTITRWTSLALYIAGLALICYGAEMGSNSTQWCALAVFVTGLIGCART